MTKKAYTEAPDILMTKVQLQGLMAGSPKAKVGEEEILDYESTPGDASGGLSRRRTIWDDDQPSDEY